MADMPFASIRFCFHYKNLLDFMCISVDQHEIYHTTRYLHDANKCCLRLQLFIKFLDT